MEIIQSIGWYFPESTGGSEVYLAGLASGLRDLGVESRIVAPLNGDAVRDENWQGVPVHRYAVSTKRTRTQSAGLLPHGHFEAFETWLRSQRIDLYHQHSWTYGCGLPHLQAAKRLGLPCVLTVHVPGVSCLRGTMMRNGEDICDGRVQAAKCGACWLQSRGLATGIGQIIARVPAPLGKHLHQFGRVGSVLAAGWMAGHHLDTLMHGVAAADKVVAVCDWLYDALLLNGVPAEKLVLNRQGVSSQVPNIPVREQSPMLRVGFLGRWDPLKGIDILVDAVRGMPSSCPVDLRLHAVESDEPHVREYQQQVMARAADDPRIKFLPALAPSQVPDFLDGIDILAVPSRWLETGPLVVLEAFSRGVPVIGSDLGGISELVNNGVNGILVRHDDLQAWTTVLAKLVHHRDGCMKLQSGIGQVRSMRDVAEDMKRLYATLI